ncbi:MAG: universal stress protein [Actinomycetota bacterium]|nr:universal stress protein [Actinomycetota bacterium]
MSTTGTTVRSDLTSTTDKSRGAVVVGLDADGSAVDALDWAIEDAARRHRPLHLVCAAEPVYPDVMAGAIVMDTADDNLARVLDAAVARVHELAPALTVHGTAERLRALDVLVHASHTADTLVVGTHGRSRLGTLVLGSTSLQVVSQATCPVVVVRHAPPVPAPESLPRIVVGVDGSAVSMAAVDFAFAQADARGIGLTVVHGWNPNVVEGVDVRTPSGDRWREAGQLEVAATAESIAGHAALYPDVDVRTHVIRKSPVDALVAEADGAELVVVGSRGWGDVRGLLLGSVSQAVLRRVPCPVAVVRPRPAQGEDA